MRNMLFVIALVLSSLSIALNIMVRLRNKGINQRDDCSDRSEKTYYFSYEFQNFGDLFSFCFAIFVYIFTVCLTLCYLICK